MGDKKILIIDETIREGMQFQGVMFSPEQRCRILNFQEKLGVDICQAGYPPAHDSEILAVQKLITHAREKKFNIRIAAMGRASLKDLDILAASKADDFHFHIHIKENRQEKQLKQNLKELGDLIDHIKTNHPGTMISVAMLDIGRFPGSMLEYCLSVLKNHELDILSLPDTSGLLSPNQLHEKIESLSNTCGNTRLSVHCHNDMGMATANGVMGIIAGATVLEASVMGIGERNGISDLFTAAKTLKDQGFEIALNIDDLETFNHYYNYVDSIVHEQTEIRLLNACTPFFGKAVKTHVAGTHAKGEFGRSKDEDFSLNVLCGKHLVKKYLDLYNITFPQGNFFDLTREIKNQSARLNRSLSLADVRSLISIKTDWR